MPDANGWMEIESAPRDGTRVLAYDDDAGLMVVVWWWSGRSCWLRDGDDYDIVVYPAHFQPLPAPPSQEEG
jgi:hypothetical protein